MQHPYPGVPSIPLAEPWVGHNNRNWRCFLFVGVGDESAEAKTFKRFRRRNKCAGDRGHWVVVLITFVKPQMRCPTKSKNHSNRINVQRERKLTEFRPRPRVKQCHSCLKITTFTLYIENWIKCGFDPTSY